MAPMSIEMLRKIMSADARRYEDMFKALKQSGNEEIALMACKGK
jgi:hypothetical protein